MNPPPLSFRSCCPRPFIQGGIILLMALPLSASASVDQGSPRILAIDYGRRRLGLAVSDALGLTAQPLAVLERTSRRHDLRRLREIARKHRVARVLVGHPLGLEGTPGPMAQEAARFAARIKKELGLPVELVDERLSSWEAAQVPSTTHHRGKRAAPIDHLAAAVILRDYLSRHRPGPARRADG